MSLRTINDIFFTVVERGRDQVMLQREAIDWVPISSGELHRKVSAIAHALASWGIGKGDRVAVLSENRHEWSVADFAILLLGAVVVPVYTTLTDEQTGYILCDSGARVIFVSSEKQLQKVLAIQGQTRVEKIVVMDAVETAHALHMHRLTRALNSPRRFGDHYLHLGHHGHSQRCDVDAWQSRFQHLLFAAGLQGWRRTPVHLVSAPLACYCPARGSRDAVPRRDAGLLLFHRATSSGLGGD